MKRVVSIILLLAMLCTSFGIQAAAATVEVKDNYVLGDVNGDGVVDAKDELSAAKYLSGAADASIIRNALDLDADSNATAHDVYLLKQCLAGQKNIAEYETANGGVQALYNLTIAENPISTYCIVLDADVDKDGNAYYAATELQRYVKSATGVVLPISLGTATMENVIRFHQYDELSEEGLVYGIEGYRYEVIDGQVNIYGTRRGNMFSVYELLEDYLGYRFYNGTKTAIMKQRTVDIPEGLFVNRTPQLEFRFVSQSVAQGGSDALKSYHFPRKMNGSQTYSLYEPKYGTPTGPHFINAHSFGLYYQMYDGNYNFYLNQGYNPSEINDLLYKEAAMEELIEGFPTIETRWRQGYEPDQYGWQPCFTSETEYEHMFIAMLLTIKMITREWKSHVIRRVTSSMSFSINDNGYFCTCANCSTIYSTDGRAGGMVYMANKAIDDVQEYYPGMKLYFILYDGTIPQTIFPKKDLIIMYCGTGCQNHYIGSGDCLPEGNSLYGGNNFIDAERLKAWSDICRRTGAEMWFWYYPVTYHYYLVGCPNILNIYYDFKYVAEECGLSGIYYEGGGRTYNFEELKAYLAARVIESPDMTVDEFYDLMLEYLYLHYGDGAPELMEYILLQDEAGNRAGCFINNYDRPHEMYDYSFIAEHYEEMRELLTTALAKTGDAAQRKRIETLIICCDFLGLTCVQYKYHLGVPEMVEWLKDGRLSLIESILKRLYNDELNAEYAANGVTQELLSMMIVEDNTKYATRVTKEAYLDLLSQMLAEMPADAPLMQLRAIYAERYIYMINYIKANHIDVFSDLSIYNVPEEINLDDSPMFAIYEEERVRTRYP